MLAKAALAVFLSVGVLSGQARAESALGPEMDRAGLTAKIRELQGAASAAPDVRAGPAAAVEPNGPRFPSESQLEWAFRVAWGEIRSRPDMEVQTVCHVMLNRMLQRKWGDNLEDVVRAKKQFSALNPDDPNRAKLLSPDLLVEPTYKRIRDICTLSFNGRFEGFFIDPTDGCDHYWHGPTPYWAEGMKPMLIGETRCVRMRPVPALTVRR